MPESLDDTTPNPQDVLGPTQKQSPIQQPVGVMGDVSMQDIKIERREEIDRNVSATLTNQLLEREILDEKVRQDIENTKKNKDLKTATTARDVLKTLISLGDYKEDVEIFNHTWTIKALNQGDITAAFNDVKDDNITTAGRISSLVISQIAYAVEACDGQPIYEWFPDVVKKSEYDSSEEFKLAARRVFRRYLEKMPNSIIDEFDKAYTKIEKRRNEAIEELKKS